MASITRVVCLGGDTVSEHDVINWKQTGFATVDVRPHNMVLLISVNDADLKVLSPLNLFPGDELVSGQMLPYDGIMFRDGPTRHAVKINDKWRELEFTGGYW